MSFFSRVTRWWFDGRLTSRFSSRRHSIGSRSEGAQCAYSIFDMAEVVNDFEDNRWEHVSGRYH
ncbi:hypothetical protein ACWCZ5_32000 [Streptomyces sp. NPDC001667]